MCSPGQNEARSPEWAVVGSHPDGLAAPLMAPPSRIRRPLSLCNDLQFGGLPPPPPRRARTEDVQPFALMRLVPKTMPAFRPAQAPIGNPPCSKPRPGSSPCNIDESSRLVEVFLTEVFALQHFSELHHELQASSMPKQRVARILQAFAPSTVLKYLTTWRNFARTLMDYHLQWQDLTAVQIADVLVALQLAKSDDKSNGSSPLGAIKAARWFAKLARVQVLDCLWSPVINSFLQTKIQHERKESCPFPLYVIVQWERRVLCEAASDAEVLILGGFLAILWAGLRFADAQRTKLSSLIFDLVSVRGSSFRTKTCHTGQPFGFLACGFLSAGDYSWVYKWLSTLDEYASRSSTINMDDLSLSFLIPSCDAGGPRLPLQPMSYAEALYWIRTFVHLPWKRQPCDFAVNFTVHSLKSTALSWASQLPEISEEERQRQGHHRGGSVKLYSRDDVSFQFRLQNKIIRAVQTGKRFLVPQHRGGQRPMIDPPFELERFQKEISERSWFAIHTCRAGEEPVSLQVPADETSQESDAPAGRDKDAVSIASSDSSSSSSSSESDDALPPAKAVSDPDKLLVAWVHSCQHIMVPSSMSWHPMYKGRYFKAACGSQIHVDNVRWSQQLASDMPLCRRKACQSLFAGLA